MSKKYENKRDKSTIGHCLKSKDYYILNLIKLKLKHYVENAAHINTLHLLVFYSSHTEVWKWHFRVK